MTFDIVSFGESLVRLSPPSPQRIEQTQQLGMFAAGSELNVVTTAQHLGLKTSYMTKLPDNPLGRWLRNRCREHGVDTSYIEWSQAGRMGLYFFEYGAPPRPSVAYYDRAHSVFSEATVEDFRLDQALDDAGIFLTSGINPALSASMAVCTEQAMKLAADKGCRVAFDLNYRSKLWSIDEAAHVIRSLMKYVDILFTSVADANNLLGLNTPDPADLPAQIAKTFDIETVSMIYNPEEPGVIWRAATYHKGERFAADQPGPLTTIDRLGAGDAFAGGFFYGYLREDMQRAVAIGSACMALKNTMVGDLNWATLEDVEDLIGGDISLVKR